MEVAAGQTAPQMAPVADSLLFLKLGTDTQEGILRTVWTVCVCVCESAQLIHAPVSTTGQTAPLIAPAVDSLLALTRRITALGGQQQVLDSALLICL